MRIGVIAAPIAVLAAVGLAHAAQVLAVNGTGTAYGGTGTGGYACTAPGNMAGVFDNQPASIPTPGLVTDATDPAHSGTSGSWYSNQSVVVDFGSGYSNITITATYELWRQYANGSAGPDSYYWSATGKLDGSQIAAPALGFDDPALEPANRSSDVWAQMYSGSPVTPAAEYLIIAVPSGGNSCNGLKEWVLAGTVGATPEPASLSLIGLGSLALLKRRRG